jgi:hypothetical protein
LQGALLNSFAICQTCSDGGSRLGNVVILASNWFWQDSTVVFVTPNNKIDAVIEHSFRNIFLRAVFDSGKVNSK